MKTIKIIKPIWNLKPETLYKTSDENADFAIKRGRAVEIIEEKAEPENYKNKAEKAPKKNK